MLASLVNYVSPDGACCCREHLLVSGGHDGIRLPQLVAVPHSITQPWNQFDVYQMVRRGAVHNHREPAAVGVIIPFAAASLQPCKPNASSNSASKLRKIISSSLTGRVLAPSTAEAMRAPSLCGGWGAPCFQESSSLQEVIL